MITHVAGQLVTLEGRLMRQRCAWCGHILIDHDTASGYAPPFWPAGALVRSDGSTVPGRMIPADCCAQLSLDLAANG